MKALFILVSFVLTLSISVTSVAGQIISGGTAYQGEPPASLPIYSKAALKTFALSQARQGSLDIWSETLLRFSDEIRSISILGSDADDIVKKLSAPTTKFRVKTYNKTQPVYVWGYIQDKSGNFLFESQFTQVAMVETSNGLEIQNSALSFRMSSIIPIVFPNAVSARIEHEDADGKKWIEYLGAQDGYVYFPTSYASTAGTLVVTTYYPQGGPAISPGESWDTAYTLSKGDKILTTIVSGGTSVAIENHLTGSDLGYTNNTPLILIGQMKLPANLSENSWDLVSPPTATFNVNAPAGSKRICKMVVTICPTFDLGPIKAWSHDANRVSTDGTVEELAGVVTTTSSGGVVTITATWYLDNDIDTPGGSNWHAYLEIGAYEIQDPPQSPYYGDANG